MLGSVAGAWAVLAVAVGLGGPRGGVLAFLLVGGLAAVGAGLGLGWLGARERLRELERGTPAAGPGRTTSTEAASARGGGAPAPVRGSRPAPVREELAAVVRGLAGQVQHRAGPRAMVSVEVAPVLPEVDVLQNDVEEAILGLVGLAVSSLPDGGRLAVQLGSPAPDAVELTVDAAGRRVGALRWLARAAEPEADASAAS